MRYFPFSWRKRRGFAAGGIVESRSPADRARPPHEISAEGFLELPLGDSSNFSRLTGGDVKAKNGGRLVGAHPSNATKETKFPRYLAPDRPDYGTKGQILSPANPWAVALPRCAPSWRFAAEHSAC
jgi:hypothetical protein